MIAELKISLTYFNSPFSECKIKHIRQHLVSNSSSSFSNTGYASSSYEDWLFDDIYSISTPLSSSVSFSQCTFLRLISSFNGGAISFTSDSSHTVRNCFFSLCSSTVSTATWQSCGGAVSSSVGSLSVYSSIFIICSTQD